MNNRSLLLAAGLFGATGVGLGAFGAHALRQILLERGTANAWETAVRYHLVHAVALLVLAAWSDHPAAATRSRWLGWAARCWIIGTVLFAGSLYFLALGGPRWLGPITPLGGVGLLAGWICVLAAAGRKAPDNEASQS